MGSEAGMTQEPKAASRPGSRVGAASRASANSDAAGAREVDAHAGHGEARLTARSAGDLLDGVRKKVGKKRSGSAAAIPWMPCRS